MAKQQQRAVRIEQKGQMAAMAQLESRTDAELEAETRYRSAAQAILGSRAAEKYDAPAARAHFQKALAAARPQERMQLRRMADASLALAERRAGDLKAAAAKLGVEAPSRWSLFGLQAMGLYWPPKSAGTLRRVGGILLIVLTIVLIFAIAVGIVSLIALPFGGLSLDLSIFYGIVLLFVAFGVLIYIGRRRQRSATAKRNEQIAARAGK